MTAMKKLSQFMSLTLAIAGLSSQMVSAQSTEPFSPYSSYSPSVESWQITRYGNLKPSLYTGAMRFSLPLYKYSDPDFDIPISLDYSFDGYRPSQSSGTTGYGWYLNCGGVITREVRGLPDEDAVRNMNDRTEYGYWFSVRNDNGNGEAYSTASEALSVFHLWSCFASSMGGGPVSDEAARKVNPFHSVPTQVFVTASAGSTGGNFPNFYPQYGTIGSCHYDMTPDIFHFSFMGHSGDFMLEPDGSVRVFNSDMPHGELAVEFLVSTYAREFNRVCVTGFRIKDGRGFKYYFGNTVNAVEYGSVATEGDSVIPQPGFSNTAWHLSKIEAPGGRTVEFIYSSAKQVSTVVSPYYTPSREGTGINIPATSGHTTSNSYYSVLEGIKLDGRTFVSFTYEEKELCENSNEYYDYNPYPIGLAAGTFNRDDRSLCLYEILVSNSEGDTVEKINLHYSYSDGTPKMFLQSAVSLQGGVHQFSYNTENVVFPHNDTGSTDHWGYWNGRVSYALPEIVAPNGTTGYYVCRYDMLTNNSKTPDASYSMKGALTGICYPAGGSTSIEYESNSVSSCLEEEGMIHEIPDGEMQVGGVRVSRTEDRADSAGVAYTTEFEYSDGFLFHMPRYAMRLPIVYKYIKDSGLVGNANGTAAYSITGYGSDCDYDMSRDCLLGYGSVTTIHPDLSRTTDTFSNYSGRSADVYSDASSYYIITKRGTIAYTDSFESSEGNYSPYIAMPSSDRRNMRGLPLSTSIYGSDGKIRRRTTWTYASDTVSLGRIYWNNLDSFASVPWECHSPLLASESVADYSDDDMAGRTIRQISYNAYGQMTEETVFSPLLSGDALKTYYSYCHESSDNVLPGAVQSIARSRIMDGTEYPADKVEYVYSSPQVHTKPQIVSRHKYEDGADCGTEMTVFSYDNSTLLPLQVNLPGGESVSYVWEGTNIVSKTENGLTSSFTWSDMIGLSGVVSPSGRSESYTYDSRNRLKTVSGTGDRLKREYDYNIRYEN